MGGTEPSITPADRIRQCTEGRRAKVKGSVTLGRLAATMGLPGIPDIGLGARWRGASARDYDEVDSALASGTDRRANTVSG